MAILFDAFTESDASGSGGGTEPFIHVNGAGNQGILLLAMFVDSVADSVTSVTYGGDTLTNLYDDFISSGRLWVGYLLAPQVGSYNIDVVFSGGPPSVYRGGVVTFSGVSQTAPTGGTASEKNENSNVTPLDVTVTVTGTRGTVVDFFYGTRTSAGNADSTQTEKMNNTGSWGGGVNHLGGISYKAHTGSDVTMEWESLSFDSGAADQLHYAVELLVGTEFVPQIHIL